MLQRIASFLQESKQELKRVNWPTMPETIRMTSIVIGISLGISAFLGILDFIFSAILQRVFL